ncbi:transposable element Tcb1 transposase [Trichonephila clavipes]|nr:transposable element Tcb1 transposase [Trichonephila clavipes]
MPSWDGVGSILNSRRAASPLVRLVEGKERGRIVAYRDCGLSFTEINNRVGKNQTTIMRICDRWMQEGTTDRRARLNPPQCTTSLSARVIRRRLQQSGLSARRSLLGLPLTQNHRRLRRQWSDERMMWVAEWNEVVFTDESGICLQHHDGRIRVWTHRGERMLNSCVMHHHNGPAPGIMVWGGIGFHSRTPLVRSAGILNSQCYISEVLVSVVIPYLQGLATAIFQQGNARPHVAHIVQRFFVKHQIELLLWPARSLDLSPIENMWSMVAQRLTQITPQLPHQINFGNVWKLLCLLYPKNTSKVLWNQCRVVWQRCQVIYSQFGLAIHQNDHQAKRRFVEWAQNEIAVVPDFHKRILFSDDAQFWLNGYVNKQNCRIWSEANPQVYVETPLHPEKLTVWCALWVGGILLQKR